MPRPNVLVLLADQQRADTLEDTSCETPNLDRLAAEGTRFSRCYAPNSVCSPARASLMTGELPHTHGMTHVTHTVPAHQASFRTDLPTWSERLDDAGYHLGHVGKWHVERSNDLEQFGYDVNLSYRSDAFREAFAAYREANDLPEIPGSEWRAGTGAAEDGDRYRPADGTVGDDGLDLSYTVRGRGYNDFTIYGTHDRPPAATRDYYAATRGCEFVRDAADRDEPWCLTVSTFGPHDPFVVPREYYDRYDPAVVEKPPNFEDAMADKPELYRLQRGVWDDMEWRHFAEATACYYAYCTFLDEGIGRLLDALEETGQADDTVVIFASDHGDLMGAHRLLLKGHPAFEEAYRVPLVVRDPSRAGGRVRDDIVQSLDLAPTIAALAGAEPMDCFGTSLVPFLDGERPAGHRNEAYAEFFGQRFYWTHRVLWDGRYKYVFNGGARDELYDLAEDPHERDNLARSPEHRGTVERMAARVWELADETGDDTLADAHYPMLRFAPVGPNATDLDLAGERRGEGNDNPG